MLHKREAVQSSLPQAFLVLILLIEASAATDRGFLLAAPKRLLAGSTERMCLTFLNVTGPVNIHLHVLRADSDERLASVSHRARRAEEAPCLSLPVPASAPAERARLLVQARFDDAYDYVVSAVREVRVQTRSLLVFVQTDRPAYRPGQRVRVRVLVLRHDFAPADGAVAAAWVQSPAEVRLAQWTRPVSRLGLLELDYLLGQEPPQGTWTVKVSVEGNAASVHTASFAVREYVLPRFSVTISGPRHVLADAHHVTWHVCAHYAHGEPVSGRATVRAEVRVPFWRAGAAAAAAAEAAEGQRPGASLVAEVRGCTSFNVSAQLLGLRDWDTLPAAVFLNAEVSEAGTGQTENASAQAAVEHQALQLAFEPHSPRHFKPGLPYAGRLRACRPGGDAAPGHVLQLCLKARRRREWSRSLVQCRNFTSDAGGFVRFRVPPQPEDVQLLSLVATAVEFPTQYFSPSTRWRVLMDQPSAFFDVYSWFSPSGSFLEIVDENEGDPRCGSQLRLTVYHTHPPPPGGLRYLVMARGDMEQAGEAETQPLAAAAAEPAHSLGVVASPGAVAEPGRMQLQLPVTAHMSPASALLLYYARPDGEVVAAALALRPAACFANPAAATFLRARQAPGGEAALRLRAAPGSLCALAAVDRATAALGVSSLLSPQRAFRGLEPFHIEPFHMPRQADDFDYCSRKATSSSPETDGKEPEEPWDLRRRRRSLSSDQQDAAPPFKFVDAMQAFDEAGVLVLSDLTLETRPCLWPPRSQGANSFLQRGAWGQGGLPPSPQEYMAPSPVLQQPTAMWPSTSEPEVRSHFPETWLWELFDLGNSSSLDVRRRLPDSITEWEATMSCVAPEVGLGVSPTTRLTAFQPFFLDLVLPYSMKRGEILQLHVSVFNYLSHSLPVRVTLQESAGLEILSNSSWAMGCVMPETSLVLEFRVQASQIGVLNVTATAEVEPMLPEQCGPEVLVAHRDAILKPLLVVAEGFPVQVTQSAFICPANFSGDSNVVWTYSLPSDVVENSARAEVNLVADLLGPTLQNLDHLVRLPMGCGEQNMILFVPNLHVLDYLNATNQLGKEVHTEILKNLQKGYQRQLNYRHSDGSYSAFGDSDTEGSLWLTAFVVRSLAHARSHIFVDEKDLRKSVSWVINKQLENGCFPSIGQVFHKSIKGGLTDDTPSAGLTAYVLISLLESGLQLPTAVTSNALFCLKADSTSDPYVLALKTYALLLLKDQEPKASTAAEDSFRHLIGKSSNKNGLMWWEKPGSKNSALDVETTAYGVLAMLLTGRPEYFLQALSAVRWIAGHGNTQGGFVSTQDTVVALEALSHYSRLVPQQRTALAVLVTAKGVQETFLLDHAERLVMQSVSLPQLPTGVEVQAEGEGCALIQTFLRYNVNTPSGNDAFELVVKTGPVASVDACAVQRVEACVRFKLPGHTSNMGVLEVHMVSGYKPDRTSLHQLAQNPGVGFKRWEEEGDQVNFYFDELTNKQYCINFLIKQDVEVENPSFAIVRVFDYYQQELSLTQKYSTDAGCRNERLPDPQPNIGKGLLTDYLVDANSSMLLETSEECEHVNDTGEDIPGHLNPQFVNIDMELETPTGDGPVPEFLHPQADSISQSIRISPEEDHGKTISCPHCEDTFPEDFPILYCNATYIYKLSIKKSYARILLDLTPRRDPQRMRKTIILDINEECFCKPLVRKSKIQHVVVMHIGKYTLPRRKYHIHEHLTLDSSTSVIQVPVQHGLPERIKQVKHTCL